MKEIKLEIPSDCEVVEIETRDGHVVITLKENERELPKSWEEFCEMFPITSNEKYINGHSFIAYAVGCQRDKSNDKNLLPDRATAEAVLALMQLIQLRDCFNGDWVPDWNDSESWKYVINFCEYPPYKPLFTSQVANKPTLLYFKTSELRDEFLHCFRPLIEKLKPLYGIKKGGDE